MRDQFTDDRQFGKVIGSRGEDGTVRKGIDQEGVLAIDNDALRIQPLIRAGWGRAGLAYGPFPRASGLALAVYLLNGHNTSQSGTVIEGFPRRIWRWLRGSGTNSIMDRFSRWVRTDHPRTIFRRLHWWIKIRPGNSSTSSITDNLAVGWFASEVPADPTQTGHSFVMHAAGPTNGELRARVATHLLPIINSIQNLPLYYVIILRQQGAAYYAASVEHAHGLVAYPQMRPLTIDPLGEDTNLYTAIYQSVLGEIGFRLDTRVYATAVEQLDGLATWYGTAHAADPLDGSGALAGSAAVGGVWHVPRGGFERTLQGVQPTAADSLAILSATQPVGLVHILIDATTARTAPASPVDLIWRYQDQDNYWGCHFSNGRWRLYIKVQGHSVEIATDDDSPLAIDAVNSLQLLDDGATFAFALNGQQLFGCCFVDERHQAATGVGFQACGPAASICLRAFEAHPRSVPLPPALDVGAPWTQMGCQTAVVDTFTGPFGDLADHQTTIGGQQWRKEIGQGAIDLTGEGGARVRATVATPNPGRTAYTVAWDHPTLADLQMTITSPGTAKGQGESGRGGFILWQDAHNYITISTWLDDHFDGTSISSFFHINGFEELYDAVWTNIGRRVCWGVPYRFRVVCDGMHYLVFVNDEPVLYRALTDVYPQAARLQIRRVGIVANWEWGNDTGSLFNNFVARF